MMLPSTPLIGKWFKSFETFYLLLRNVVYATRSNQMKSGNKFAALGHAVYRAYYKVDADWDEVKKQLMLVVYHLQSAAASFEELKA